MNIVPQPLNSYPYLLLVIPTALQEHTLHHVIAKQLRKEAQARNVSNQPFSDLIDAIVEVCFLSADRPFRELVQESLQIVLVLLDNFFDLFKAARRVRNELLGYMLLDFKRIPDAKILLDLLYR